MHGFGLHFMMDRRLRALSARLAFSRPLKATRQTNVLSDMTAVSDKWYYIENLHIRDRFLLALFKRYVLKHFAEKEKVEEHPPPEEKQCTTEVPLKLEITDTDENTASIFEDQPSLHYCAQNRVIDFE